MARRARISRIETGIITPTIADIETITQVLGVDADMRAALLTVARQAIPGYHFGMQMLYQRQGMLLTWPFVLYDDRLVTAELFSGEVTLTDPEDIKYHQQVFDYFLSMSLSDNQTRWIARNI